MSQRTKCKLSLLQLAEELGNVSKACQIMDYHRDTFYEVQKAFKVGGVAALVEERRGPRNPHPNRVPEAVERDTSISASRGQPAAPSASPTSCAGKASTSAPPVSAGSACATTSPPATSA